MERKTYDHKRGGFVALFSVLILSGLVLLVSIGVSLRSISLGDSASGMELSFRARHLAEACAEHALLRLSNNMAYSGNENIIVEGGDPCTVLPLEGSGNLNRVIKTEAMVRGYTARVRVDIARVRPFELSSWHNVVSF